MWSARAVAHLSACVAVMSLAGCGDDDAPPPGDDGGAPARYDSSVPPPAEPMPPVLTPCPEGFEVVDVGGIAACEPFPGTPLGDCAAGTFRPPGTRDCELVGAPCPAGDYADDLPTSALVHVRPGAAPGGDGSESAPFATIADALARVPAYGTIALARGTYDEPIHVTRGHVSFVGACTTETIVRHSGKDPLASPLVVEDATVTVENLTLSGASVGAWVGAGELTLGGVEIERFTGTGLVVLRGGHLIGHDVLVRDPIAPSVPGLGDGLQVLPGDRADLTRVVMDGMYTDGAVVSGEGAAVTWDHVLVRDTRPNPSDGQGGRVMQVDSGAIVTITASAFDGNTESGLFVVDEGSVLTVEGSVMRNMREGTGSMARAFELGGGRISAERVWVDGAREGAIYVEGTASVFELTDAIVRATRTNPAGTQGRGADLGGGGTTRMERVVFSEHADVAVLATDLGEIGLTDVVIEDTRGDAMGERGDGLAVQRGAHVTLLRAVVRRNREAAILVLEGGILDATDVAMTDTLPWVSDGRGGRGLDVERGSVARITRALVADDLEVGVLSMWPDTRVELAQVSVLRTGESTCPSPTCGISAGVAAVNDGYVSGTEVVVADGALAGLQIAIGGTMDLTRSVVRGHPIGASVVTAGFDLSRISAGVVYIDNETNLDTAELPVPASADSLDDR